jgi:hypothetical protein
VYNLLAEQQTGMGQLDEAQANAHMAMQVQPENVDWPTRILSTLAVLRGDAPNALSLAESMAPGPLRNAQVALALQMGDDRTTADAALQHLLETNGNTTNGALGIAQVYALRGDANGMFEWLNRGWQRQDMTVHYVLYNPLLLHFRNDPRFADYCRKTGLPLPAQSQALSIDQIRAMLPAKH